VSRRRRVALGLCLAALATRAGALPLPDARQVRGAVVAFDGFVDQRGQPWRAPSDVPAWVVAPMYGRCPTTCSALTAGLLAALRRSGLRAGEYGVVSFSFDPQETDTSLQAFRQRLGLPDDWVTLRATTPAALSPLLARLDFHARQLPDGGFEHPNVVLVLDRALRVVAVLPGLDLAPAELAAALRRAAVGEVTGGESYALPIALLAFLASGFAFVYALGWAQARAARRALADSQQ
jgi:cytochrome oxidase Cu insertion factor (SCO1/SenC/PrrC family)